MNRVACLGWGSLVWRKDCLKIKKQGTKEWLEDGPFAGVEFLRESGFKNGKPYLSLVLDSSVAKQKVLWTLMEIDDLEEARKNLKEREGSKLEDIHSWKQGDDAPSLIKGLPAWAKKRKIDAVIWTGLPAKHKENGNGVKPNRKEAVQFLNGLSPENKKLAKEYICKAPKQINTAYRRLFERELGWTSKRV